MRKRLAVVLAIALAATLGAALGAQSQIVQPGAPKPDHVVSGPDIGFKVEGTGREGAVKGRFVVKVDGVWKEIELVPRIRLVR